MSIIPLYRVDTPHPQAQACAACSVREPWPPGCTMKAMGTCTCDDEPVSTTCGSRVCGTVNNNCGRPTSCGSCDSSTGLCSGDACADITCTTPTSPCQVAVGTCSNGACSYPSKTLGAPCEDSNACTTDGCDAKTGCTTSNNTATRMRGASQVEAR